MKPLLPLTSIAIAIGLCPCGIKQTNAQTTLSHTIKSDKVIARDAVIPTKISWHVPYLPHADLAYANKKTWDIWVMDEHGGNKKCLTCYGNNVLGVNFPLDEDGKNPKLHWKGGPDVHPTEPIIFFKAENENSKHKPLKNAPGIGWDVDIWALDLRKKKYYRLTQVKPWQGVQHAAISDDGTWFVYPLRYAPEKRGKNFGLSKMIFSKLEIKDDVRLSKQFEKEPHGKMYYEPNDIHVNDDGSYTLLYAATDNTLCDPYSYVWREDNGKYGGTGKRLLNTPNEHEEFFTFSPDGTKVSMMKGPKGFGRYFADLYMANPDFTDISRITWYNDEKVWPEKHKPKGAQLDRITWSEDGKTLFYAIHIHKGFFSPYAEQELHRLDFE